MNKKIIAIILVLVVIGLGAYQFGYVPYQAEQNNQIYNERLQNASHINEELESYFSKLGNSSSSNEEAIDSTIHACDNVVVKIDEQVELLNNTKEYTNGNETKEKYLDYQLEYLKIEREMMSDLSQEYKEFKDAYTNLDANKMISISNKMATNYNVKADEAKTVQDNINKLLAQNPDFNQTVHGLNLTDDFYGDANITRINA